MLGQAEGVNGGGRNCAVGGNGSPRVPEPREPSGIPITILPDLAEMDLGEWEGLVQSRVRETQPEAYARRRRQPWTFRPPGGGCCAGLGTADNGPFVLAVTHAGLIRAVFVRAGAHWPG